MTEMSFTRARRSQARLRLAIIAVSGGGKTMGSLRVAKGLVEGLLDMGVLQGTIEGKIAMIDSERKSASLYADVVPFDALELEPPYSVDRYQQAVDAAERAGYAVCIIDQISHAWAGPGGQLEYIDTLKAQSRNAMNPWAKVTPIQQEFYDRILRSPMHIIATMRAKSEWVIDDVIEGGRTKKVPRKIGMSPVQREGIEYEFTTCLDVDLEAHMATASKDRTRLFMGRSTLLDEACGRKLAEWLQTGEATTIEKRDPAAAGQQPAGDQNAGAIAELEEAVTDFELGFIDCATLPDLAAHFDKGQKFVRGFVKDLGAERVKPYLDRLIAAKDQRKAAIGGQAPKTGAARTVLWNEKNEEVAQCDKPIALGDEVTGADGRVWIAGTLAQRTADGDTWYAKPKPLAAQADPNKISPEDVKRLASFAANEGLDEKETLDVLGVAELGELHNGSYAAATEKIMNAARAKLKKAAKPARAKAAA